MKTWMSLFTLLLFSIGCFAASQNDGHTVASEAAPALFEAWSLERMPPHGLGEDEELRSKTSTVCTASKYSDIQVNVTVSYTYNTKTGVACNVTAAIAACSSVPSRNPVVEGSCQADYNTGSQKIQGVCTGALVCTADGKNEIENLQNVQFTIEP